jgi:membrane protein YdbS with pleckstrin-like domain
MQTETPSEEAIALPRTNRQAGRSTQLNESALSNHADHEAKQALALWSIFIVVLVIINGTIPFLMGADLYVWSYSTAKLMLASFIYAVIFLVPTLILVKGWKTVREPRFFSGV